MAKSLFTRRPAWRTLFASISIVALTSASIYCATHLGQVRAEDPKEEKPAASETDPDYAVPDGTPDEIMEFVEKLKARKPKFANRKESVDHAIRMYRAFIEAGDKILKQDVEGKVATDAAQLKLNSLTVLAANSIGDAAQEALTAATEMRQDKRKEVAKAVEQFWMPIRIFNIGSMSEADRKGFADEVVASVTESKFSRQAMSGAMQLGDALARRDLTDEAGSLFDRLVKAAKEADDPELKQDIVRLEGTARRLRLPGSFMDLQGKMLNGEAFDWSSYRGKIVLVDFWATWCGPCVAELPNVKRNYETYHEKGFEIVGISLDRSREPLDKFIEKNEMSWSQLYDEEIQKGKGWNHPMAEHFGINAIPAAILVDKDGKVVSMNARGEELTNQLEKLLGKAE